MNSGPELDKLIGVLVFGATPPFERFSTNLACAFRVLDKLHAMGWSWCIERTETSPKPTVWIVKRTVKAKFTIPQLEDLNMSSENLAHAICLVALKVLE